MSAIAQIARRLASRWRAPAPVALNDWDLCAAIHPMEAADAHGGRLIAKDGREYVDLLSAWGANLLGYGYPRVAAAMREQSSKFAGVGMPTPQFWELARRLGEIIPCAGAVRYGKNGSDATLGAVRLARAVTGREHVLHRGYHGFHDWWQASIDCSGVPAALREKITTLGELTPASVAAAFDAHAGGVACLILDPMVPPIPDAQAMAEIAEIVRRNGALLIFDEIVSGFRLAPGGMQEVWGVAPDLASFGKSIANGMPLSVIAGGEPLMRRLPEVHYGMTFEGEAVSIAAARATVDEVIEKDVCAALAQKGRRLKAFYDQAALREGVQSRLIGPDARPILEIHNQSGLSGRALRWLLLQELSRAQVLSVGTISLCFSHGDTDLEQIEKAFEQALHAAAKALRRGSVAGLLDDRIGRALA